MRRTFLAIMVAVVVLMSVNFAVASCSTGNCGEQNVDIGISNRNNNTNTATAKGGNAKQDQNQRQLQDQRQNQGQLQWSNSNSGGNVYEDAKNHITASTLQNFVAAVKPSTPEGWKLLGCDFIVAEFTVGQLKSMAEGASFMKKRGTFWYAAISDDVEYSIIGVNGVAMSDTTVIRIVTKIPRRVKGGAYLGEAEGIGRYGAPMGQIIGATVLGLVQRTGTTQVVLYWDYLIEGVAMSNTVGVGVAGSATNGEAGSIAIGGAGSTTYNLTSIAYRIKAQAFTGLGEDFFSCGAPEQPKGCDPSSILKRIDDLRKKTDKCLDWCFNNFVLRSQLGEAYVDLYQCTGDKKYLTYAIKEYGIAERNYLRGKDIKNYRVEADKLMVQDYYFWSGCINVLYGTDAADKFAEKHGIEKVPQL